MKSFDIRTKFESNTEYLFAGEVLCVDLADTAHVGFQYVDFAIEGNDLLFLCRTALNGANSYHDSNYSTFHRIKNFREI